MLAAGQLDQIMPGVQRLVAPNGGLMTGAGTNTYLLGAGQFIVLDPGPADAAHISRIIEITHGRIAAIVVTHTHRDHSLAAWPLAQATRAPMLGATIADDGHQDLTFKSTCQLGEGDRITVENLSMRVIATPGHVANHSCLLLDESGLLFTGDHLNQGTTVVIIPPSGSMSQYLSSLRKLQAEPVSRIAPGHGHVIDDAQQEILRIINHRMQREAKVVDCLRRAQPVLLEDLLPAVYDDVAPRLHGLAKSSLLAHLLKLAEEGAALHAPDATWRLSAAASP
jgi:glyoxylase-like metal-dependent hydrolase (beta-lactamase superfamily II)